MVSITKSTFCFLCYVCGQLLLIKNSNTASTLQFTESRPKHFAVLFPDDYETNSPPKANGSPTVLSVALSPWKIGKISVDEMTLRVDITFIIIWEDPRIKFIGNDGVPEGGRIILNVSEASRIWKPIMSFRNVMGAKGMTHDKHYSPLKLYGKTMIFVVRTVEDFHCHFDLSMYPMDTQSCAIEIQVLNYKSSVILRDINKHHELKSNSEPPQFAVINQTSGKCARPDGMSRIYDCLEYRFTLRRQIGHHVMLTYVPSCLIVILTWISFWLGFDVIPARVMLGVTSLLTIATQFSSTQKNLPPVSYVKALDIWMLGCIFMVFGSIIEFAIAYYMEKRSEKSGNVSINQHRPYHIPKYPLPQMFKKKNRCKTTVDDVAKILFPTSFIVFVISYGGYYGTHYLNAEGHL